MATIWPTTPDKGEQGILSWFNPETNAGFALAIGSNGGATAILGHGSGAPIRLSVGKTLKARTWYRIWASFDRAKDLSLLKISSANFGARWFDMR
jgi:N,N-dimethylformamidase